MVNGGIGSLHQWFVAYNVTSPSQVIRGQTTGYNVKRLPSYCDRVLYKSLPALESNIRLTHYVGCPHFLTSDHKPIRAAFEVSPTPAMTFVEEGYPKITFYDLAAKGKQASKQGSTSVLLPLYVDKDTLRVCVCM